MMLNAIDVIGSPKPPTLIAIISDGDLSLEEKERVVAQRLQLGGCNLYETDSVWGYNALHWAIKLSSPTLVQLLCESGFKQLVRSSTWISTPITPIELAITRLTSASDSEYEKYVTILTTMAQHFNKQWFAQLLPGTPHPFNRAVAAIIQREAQRNWPARRDFTPFFAAGADPMMQIDGKPLPQYFHDVCNADYLAIKISIASIFRIYPILINSGASLNLDHLYTFLFHDKYNQDEFIDKILAEKKISVEQLIDVAIKIFCYSQKADNRLTNLTDKNLSLLIKALSLVNNADERCQKLVDFTRIVGKRKSELLWQAIHIALQRGFSLLHIKALCDVLTQQNQNTSRYYEQKKVRNEQGDIEDMSILQVAYQYKRWEFIEDLMQSQLILVLECFSSSRIPKNRAQITVALDRVSRSVADTSDLSAAGDYKVMLSKEELLTLMANVFNEPIVESADIQRVLSMAEQADYKNDIVDYAVTRIMERFQLLFNNKKDIKSVVFRVRQRIDAAALEQKKLLEFEERNGGPSSPAVTLLDWDEASSADASTQVGLLEKAVNEYFSCLVTVYDQSDISKAALQETINEASNFACECHLVEAARLLVPRATELKDNMVYFPAKNWSNGKVQSTEVDRAIATLTVMVENGITPDISKLMAIIDTDGMDYPLFKAYIMDTPQDKRRPEALGVCLYWAIENDDLDMVGMLIKSGANLLVPFEGQDETTVLLTALHRVMHYASADQTAARENALAIFHLLLDTLLQQQTEMNEEFVLFLKKTLCGFSESYTDPDKIITSEAVNGVWPSDVKGIIKRLIELLPKEERIEVVSHNTRKTSGFMFLALELADNDMLEFFVQSSIDITNFSIDGNKKLDALKVVESALWMFTSISDVDFDETNFGMKNVFSNREVFEKFRENKQHTILLLFRLGFPMAWNGLTTRSEAIEPQQNRVSMQWVITQLKGLLQEPEAIKEFNRQLGMLYLQAIRYRLDSAECDFFLNSMTNVHEPLSPNGNLLDHVLNDNCDFPEAQEHIENAFFYRDDHGFYDYDHSDIYDYYHSDLRLLYRAPHDHGQYYIGTANGLQDSTRIREFRPIRSPELIKKLFDMGLRPNYADMAKRGVIHKEVFEHTSWKERNTSAMWALLLHTVENGSIEDVIFLLDNQCDTGYVNKKEKAQVTHTALLVALHIMDVEKIKFLLAHIKANVKTAAARPAYENLVTLEESDVHYAAYSEKRKELKVTSFDTMLQAIQKMILDLVKSHSLVEGKSPSVYGELLTAYLKDSRKDDLSISSLTTLRKALKEKGCATHAEWIVLIDQRTAELNAASPATLLTHARKDWQKSQNEGVAESSAQGAGVAARPRSMSWSS